MEDWKPVHTKSNENIQNGAKVCRIFFFLMCITITLWKTVTYLDESKNACFSMLQLKKYRQTETNKTNKTQITV